MKISTGRPINENWRYRSEVNRSEINFIGTASGVSTVNNDIELYINGYYDTSNKRLTEAKYCTDISENCDDIIKSHDGTVWNFFADMTVALQNNYKCIKITKDYAIVSSECISPVNGMVCRLDCCKIFSTILNIYE